MIRFYCEECTVYYSFESTDFGNMLNWINDHHHETPNLRELWECQEMTTRNLGSTTSQVNALDDRLWKMRTDVLNLSYKVQALTEDVRELNKSRKRK